MEFRSPTMFDRDVEVAVRDGTTLRVDVLRPEDGGRYPVLLNAQPYGKDDVLAHISSGRTASCSTRFTRGSASQPPPPRPPRRKSIPCR